MEQQALLGQPMGAPANHRAGARVLKPCATGALRDPALNLRRSAARK